MKKPILKLWVMLALTGLCSSCSNSLDDLVVQSHELPVTDVTVMTEGSAPAKALAVANAVLQKNQSRSAAMPEFAYVLNKLQSRSLSLPDTLACVVNYPNDGGFVIVANDPRVESVLAYSDTGNFSFDNEIAKVNFIDKIGAYIEQAVANPAPRQAATSSSSNEYLEVEPFSKMLLGQWDPWNKYVVKHHPGWPVGCVAVAAATVMTYSREHLEYKGSEIALDCIERSIVGHFEEPKIKNDHGIYFRPLPFRFDSIVKLDSIPTIDVTCHTYYVYNEAVDRMAKFLDQISTDLDVMYETSISGNLVSNAYNINALTLLKSLNFEIPNGTSIDGMQTYNIQNVTNYLKTRHIVMIFGKAPTSNPNVTNGHAWIIDGCRYKMSADATTIVDSYLHCDWGWAGVSNGYFSGNVFNSNYGNYSPYSYFAVKREY